MPPIPPNRERTVALEYSEELAQQSALQGLSARTEPTPNPSGEESGGGGIVRRANEFRTKLGPVALESIGLHGMEVAKANWKRAGELYRNEFPHFEPRFTHKCEECDAEYDEEHDVCPECGSSDLREPSRQQRTEAKEFFESVNREGQSLRALYKFLERDAGRLGVWIHVVKKKYGVLEGEIFEEVQELVRADPKRLKPVVDGNGRLGGHWWACPVHREHYTEEESERHGWTCPECDADLRDVHYAEVDSITDKTPSKVYFEDEVITHAPFVSRLAGHDGLSPVALVWLKQAILEWMDLYAAGFYDQNNTNRFPGKMGFIHTTNKAAVEKQLDQAKDEQDQDAYAQGFIYNEVPRKSESTDQVQVIDMMSDEILGQSDQLKSDYKSDIRSVYGLTDAQDSELEDAGGLNNEGLQLEINDRDKAAAQQELRDGPLRKLMDVLGYSDWELTFVPPTRDEEEMTAQDVVQAAATAEQAGIPYRIEDGRLEVADTDGVVEPEPAPEEPAETDGPPDSPEAAIGLEADNPSRSADDVHTREEALRTLEEGFKHLVWPDTEELADVEQQAAQPFFSDDQDMPEFVKELVEDALESGAIHRGEYDAPNVTGEAVKRFFEDQLTQPQGWSLRSLAENFADRWQISIEQAMDTLRPQVANVLNESRRIGYERQGDTDDRTFKWLGPSDEETTEPCQWLKEITNPDYGAGPMIAEYGVPEFIDETGQPVTLEELEQLIEIAQERWFPDFNGDMAVHYNERHTFVEHFD